MMKKNILFFQCTLLLIGMAIFFSCEKEPSKAEPVANIETVGPFEELSYDYVTEGNPEAYATDRADAETIPDRCCSITLTSFTNDGILHYSIKNPSIPNLAWARRRITVLDGDYGGVMYQYSWGLSYNPCSTWSVKTHLGQIVKVSLSDCLNRYQALMEIQLKQPNGAWLTCSSSLSPVFTLGTNPNCE